MEIIINVLVQHCQIRDITNIIMELVRYHECQKIKSSTDHHQYCLTCRRVKTISVMSLKDFNDSQRPRRNSWRFGEMEILSFYEHKCKLCSSTTDLLKIFINTAYGHINFLNGSVFCRSCYDSKLDNTLDSLHNSLKENNVYYWSKEYMKYVGPINDKQERVCNVAHNGVITSEMNFYEYNNLSSERSSSTAEDCLINSPWKS